MNSWITLANYTTATAALMLMIINMISVLVGRSMDQWSRRFFGIFFGLLLLYTFSNYVSVLWEILPEPHFTLRIKYSLYFESLLSGMMIPLLTVYLLRCTGEDLRRSRVFLVILALFVLYFALLTVTQFTRFIYYFTPDQVYHRGAWYPLLLVPTALSMVALFVAVFRRRTRLSRRQFYSFLLYILLPLFGMLIQAVFYGLYMVVLSTTLAAMFLYIFMMMDQAEQNIQRQEELARQRASILVLQMRPHFIYNTLLSIYYLCAQDTKKAQQIILDFSSYLRQNFTAIVKEDTIPFTEELEHTRAYLAVEQARYEDRLSVEFDTPFTRFRLPPLTLQPIVENAVKHGVDPELGPLRIKVEAREAQAASVITVTDNGPGYASADDLAPHVALSNIRERLKLMCGGTLDIRTGETGGTVVTVTIPEKNRRPE
ncbi:MAG: histidine kinase [Oscillospiraceae bacterium]|nr:histidine kinase [Oscillospiraceae bacterium]